MATVAPNTETRRAKRVIDKKVGLVVNILQ